ncbi:STAS domain-containing protein [Exilibacterium tricleocarpae]|uniref:STAS domain-containing protein n=1 Tax=Exilibacterium tricleocarpae TaxID=2591008 RepID=UPI003CCC7630
MTAPLCQISAASGPHYVLITVAGVLDTSGSDRLIASLEVALSDSRLPLLLDFTGVNKTCSRIFRHLLMLRRRFGDVKLLCICRPLSHMRRLINLTGLDRFVDIYDNRDAATAAVGGGRGVADR